MINATLVVQTANFCIAYFVIRYLFFKPVVEAYQSDEKQLDDLRADVTRATERVTQLQQQTDQLWAQTTHYCSQKYPLSMPRDLVVFRNVTPSYAYDDHDSATIERLSDACAQQLVDRLRQSSKETDG